MEQSKALTALEPFLALIPSTTSPRAAMDLIQRATKAPGTYIFTELLTAAPIAALATSDDAAARAWHTHLSLFSHGLYSTYTAHDPPLPPLDAQQTLKLRQLSLLTLSRDKAQLTYPRLLAHLGLTTARELEDVVIAAVYAGVLVARLNPARQEVQVSSVAPLRDVAAVPDLVRVLQQWSARCDATLRELEATITEIRAEAAAAAAKQRDAAQLVDDCAEEIRADGGGDGAPVIGKSGFGRAHRNARKFLAARTTPGIGGGGGGGGGAAKRGMGEVSNADEEGEDDDEAMELDDGEGGDGGKGKQNLARRRKL